MRAAAFALLGFAMFAASGQTDRESRRKGEDATPEPTEFVHADTPRSPDECIRKALRTLKPGTTWQEVDKRLADVTIRRSFESQGGCGSFHMWYHLIGGKQVVVMFEGVARGFRMWGVAPVEPLTPWPDIVEANAEPLHESPGDPIDASTIRQAVHRPIDAP